MRPCIWALATAETRVAAHVAPISRMEAHVMERKGEPGEARLHYDQRAQECGKLWGPLTVCAAPAPSDRAKKPGRSACPAQSLSHPYAGAGG